jgi:hypothetical protein
MCDLKTVETVRGALVKHKEVLYAQAHYQSWPT